MIAGFSTDTNMLIAVRVVQGIGVGGLMSLVMIAVALIISPRERGKYMGVVGGIMALGTIGGPLLGGLLTDVWGWRSNFFVGVPFAILALVLLQFTLHLPKPQRDTKVSIDYFGIVLLAVGVSTLLIWVSMGGNQFDWDSLDEHHACGHRRRRDRRVSSRWSSSSRNRSCRCRCSETAPSPCRSSLRSPSASRCSPRRCSSRSTSSSPVAPRPPNRASMTIPMIIGQMGASIIIGQLVSRFGK